MHFTRLSKGLPAAPLAYLTKGIASDANGEPFDTGS